MARDTGARDADDTLDSDGIGTGQEKERDAIGGFLSPARHAPDDGQDQQPVADAHRGSREERNLPGPPGDVNTRNQMTPEDEELRPSTVDDGSEAMTAAEQAGQVAFGAGNPSGEEGATGAESSSG